MSTRTETLSFIEESRNHMNSDRIPMLSARGTKMQSFTNRIRAFSTQVHSEWPQIVFVGRGATPRQNSLLGPNDVQFPFPGDVSYTKSNMKDLRSIRKTTESSINAVDEVLRRTEKSIGQLLVSDVTADDVYVGNLKKEALEEAQNNAPDVPIELSAMPCPRLLKKEMKHLFPQMDMSQMDVNVMNLTQKSEHDMKAWSEAMEEEREKLTASFIASANAICTTLRRCGYWADFIDPSSGRPYLEAYTNHTLFETNDAYRQMGFSIEDLGCCKVLQHACWGSHAFVGTIFMDAPVDATIVQDILNKVNSEDV